jgi:hypothetical protein
MISPAACRQDAARFSTPRVHREIAETFAATLAMRA